jgi:hypothetical protein
MPPLTPSAINDTAFSIRIRILDYDFQLGIRISIPECSVRTSNSNP